MGSDVSFKRLYGRYPSRSPVRLIYPIMGGSPDEDPPEEDPEEETPEGDGDSPPAGAQKTDKNSRGPVPYDRFKEINDELAALKKERDDAKKESEKKTRDSLKEQEKWKELADTTQTDLDAANQQVDTLTQQVEALNSQLKIWEEGGQAELDLILESFPDEVKELDPGGDDLLARLSWARKARSLAEKLSGTEQGPKKGSTRNPKPTNSTDSPGAVPEEEARAANANFVKSRF